MRFSFALSAIALGLTSGVAASIDWGRICQGKEFTGTCTTFQSSQNGQCVSLVGTFWNDKINAISIYPGGDCQFFTDDGCAGTSSGVLYGPADFPTVKNANAFSSFQCVKA